MKTNESNLTIPKIENESNIVIYIVSNNEPTWLSMVFFKSTISRKI